jgi:hypothetical protein
VWHALRKTRSDEEHITPRLYLEDAPDGSQRTDATPHFAVIAIYDRAKVIIRHWPPSKRGVDFVNFYSASLARWWLSAM